MRAQNNLLLHLNPETVNKFAPSRGSNESTGDQNSCNRTDFGNQAKGAGHNEPDEPILPSQVQVSLTPPSLTPVFPAFDNTAVLEHS